MNKPLIFLFRFLRKKYTKRAPGRTALPRPACEKNTDEASRLIYEQLTSDSPCMIARFGDVELLTTVNYQYIQKKEKDLIGYIKGEHPEWWWDPFLVKRMRRNAGFFSNDKENLSRFCRILIEKMPLVDILGSWIPSEVYFEKELENARKVDLYTLDPYFATQPWTRALAGKKVLVVHPFAETIRTQYAKRKHLFANPDILPDFELKTIKAVQSIGGNDNGFKTWFDALNSMQKQIDSEDYDICLLGCGAYGFLLAAHVKEQGKKAFHLGGALQLLFGIRGARWEDPAYHPQYPYYTLMNEYWVRAGEKERPAAAKQVEGGCYW